MSVLVPQGSAPEFTKSQEKDEKFGNVSRIWTKQCLTYDQVMQNVELAATRREDIVDGFHSITPVVEDGKFKFKYTDGRTFVPTDHALSQYATWIGLSTTTIRELRESFQLRKDVNIIRDQFDAECIVMLLKNANRRITDNQKRVFRMNTDGTMRAFLSDRYAFIDNRWYLEAINQIIPDGLYSHWRGDDDHFNGNVLIPDTIMDKPDGDTDYGGMISCFNNEIGAGRNEECPSIFRAICMNGCIWSATEGKTRRKVHKGKIELNDIAKEIYDNITTQIPLFTVRIELFLKTMELKMQNASSTIAAVCEEFKLKPVESKEVLEQFAKFESAHKNLFGVINAITRAGQEFGGRVKEFDKIGGKLVSLTENEWGTLQKRGASFSKAKVEEIFGLAS